MLIWHHGEPSGEEVHKASPKPNQFFSRLGRQEDTPWEQKKRGLAPREESRSILSIKKPGTERTGILFCPKQPIRSIPAIHAPKGPRPCCDYRKKGDFGKLHGE